MDNQIDAAKTRRFLWGTLLAWIPFLFFMFPTMIGLFSAFRGASSGKSTGVAAVAGGFGELLSVFGLAAALVFEIVAIVLLVRAFSKEHPIRSLLSVFSVCCSGLMITILGLFLWLLFFRLPHS